MAIGPFGQEWLTIVPLEAPRRLVGSRQSIGSLFSIGKPEALSLSKRRTTAMPGCDGVEGVSVDMRVGDPGESVGVGREELSAFGVGAEVFGYFESMRYGPFCFVF